MMVSLGATGASAVMIRFWNVADLQANAVPFQFKLRQLVKFFFPVKLVSYSALRFFFLQACSFWRQMSLFHFIFTAFQFSFIKHSFQHCCLKSLLVIGNLFLVAEQALLQHRHTKTH
jgi:hypothetical protein